MLVVRRFLFTIRTMIPGLKSWRLAVIHSCLLKQRPSLLVNKDNSIESVAWSKLFETKDFRDAPIKYHTIAPTLFGQGSWVPNRLVTWKVNRWARIQIQASWASQGNLEWAQPLEDILYFMMIWSEYYSLKNGRKKYFKKLLYQLIFQKGRPVSSHCETAFLGGFSMLECRLCFSEHV